METYWENWQKQVETYPLQISVCSSWPENTCLWVELKEKRLHVPIEIAMPLPRMRSITSIYITFSILNNQESWPIVISAFQLNNSSFHSYLKVIVPGTKKMEKKKERKKKYLELTFFKNKMKQGKTENNCFTIHRLIQYFLFLFLYFI